MEGREMCFPGWGGVGPASSLQEASSASTDSCRSPKGITGFLSRPLGEETENVIL